MKLELTLCKEIIYRNFSMGSEDINLKLRIANNRLVVSDELINIWKEFFISKDAENIFENWFYGNAVLSQGYIKKVKLDETNKDEKTVIIETCLLSKDKIIVGDNNFIPINKRENIKFISNRNFNNEKNQRIKIEDISNVFNRRRIDNLFSIYETPIVIDVSMNSDSYILSKYLSLFYKDSSKVIIRDMYLDNEENLRNFKKYILPYIDKSKCEVVLQLYWGKNASRKKELELKFNNLEGYNIIIQGLRHKEFTHESFIESDKYKLNIGYRMKLFGDKDDGLTEQETVTITKK